MTKGVACDAFRRFIGGFIEQHGRPTGRFAIRQAPPTDRTRRSPTAPRNRRTPRPTAAVPPIAKAPGGDERGLRTTHRASGPTSRYGRSSGFGPTARTKKNGFGRIRIPSETVFSCEKPHRRSPNRLRRYRHREKGPDPDRCGKKRSAPEPQRIESLCGTFPRYRKTPVPKPRHRKPIVPEGCRISVFRPPPQRSRPTIGRPAAACRPRRRGSPPRRPACGNRY